MSVKKAKFKEGDDIDKEEEEGNCPVCFGDVNNHKITLECNHSFCDKCAIFLSVRYYNTCPLCRSEFKIKIQNNEKSEVIQFIENTVENSTVGMNSHRIYPINSNTPNHNVYYSREFYGDGEYEEDFHYRDIYRGGLSRRNSPETRSFFQNFMDKFGDF